MSRLFQESEATAARRRFPVYLVDATDGITAETGESAGQPQISKNGGAFANTTATLTAVGNGHYYVELTATELDTLGYIAVRYKSAATAEFNMDGQVVAFDPFDAVRGGLTALPNANADAAGGLPISDAGGLDLDTILDVAISTRLAPTVAARTLDITATGAAGVDWANVEGQATSVNLSNTTTNLVNTTTNNSDMRGTDNAALASVLGALADAAAAGNPTVSDTLMSYAKQLINVLVGDTGVTTFPAEAAPANNVSLAEVIRAIHADVTGLNGDAMRGTDSAILASSAPTNWSSMVITAGGAVDSFVQGYLNTLITETSAGRVAGNVSTFWDNADAATAQTVDDVGGGGGGGLTALSTGTAQAGAGNSITLALSEPTTVDYYQGAVVKITGGTGAGQHRVISSYSAGRVATIGPNWATNPDATSTYELVDGNVNVTHWLSGAVLAEQSGRIQSHLTSGGLQTNAVDEIRDSILSDSTPFAGANIDASVSSRATPAQVNTEVLDVLNTDTFAEPGSVPAATATIVDMLHWMYTLSRNEVQQTSTTQTLRNDADSGNIATAAVSDNGTTWQRDEWA